MPSLPRFAAAVAVAAAVCVTASSCSALGLGSDEKTWEFDRYGDAPKAGTRSFVLDAWVPTDAVDIRAVARREAPGEAVLTFDSPASPADAAGCTAVEPVTAAPPLSPAWLPDPTPTAGWSCGDWTVVADDGTVWAWRG
jgi:hypothetical protein